MYPPTQFFLTPTPMAHVQVHASHATDLCSCIALATGAPNQPTTVVGRAPGTRAGWRTGAGDVQTVPVPTAEECREEETSRQEEEVVGEAGRTASHLAGRTHAYPLTVAQSGIVDCSRPDASRERWLLWVMLPGAAKYSQLMPAHVISILDNDSSIGFCAPIPSLGTARLTVCPSFACT
jgi:hypothetical protein